MTVLGVLGVLGEPQEAGADDNLDVCKMNFCTVMLLQCRVCTSMASVGRRAYFLTVLLVLVQKRQNPEREKMI